MEQIRSPEGRPVKKRLAKFTLDFLRIENLQNGAQVYLSWGISRSSRTRVVTVVNGVADFTGESFQREYKMRRNRRLASYFHTQDLTLKLREKRHKHMSSTIALTRLDFSRHTTDWQTKLTRPFDISAWTKPLRLGLMAPVISLNVSCSWNDPALQPRPREAERPQPQAAPVAAVPAILIPTAVPAVNPTAITTSVQPQQPQQTQQSPRLQRTPPLQAKSPLQEKTRAQEQPAMPAMASTAEV